MAATQRTLTVTCVDGLSNRLRVLLSGKALAEATEREFAMRWVPTLTCGAFFHLLFQNEWKVGANVPFDEQNALDLNHVSRNDLPDLLAVNDPSLWVSHHDWLIQPKRYASHIALQTRCHELMRELTPIPSLAARIADFRDAFFRTVMIGVHLRRGDIMLVRPHWAVDVEKAMGQIDTWIESAPDAGILLCTDDGAGDPLRGRAVGSENVTAQFVRRYGERVVYTKPTSLDRRTPRAIQDALVDLWLLRATDYFLGTPKSSFSELAGLGRAATQ